MNLGITFTELIYNNTHESNDSIGIRIKPLSLGMSRVQVLYRSKTFMSTV